ncbi:MAG: formate--tetrahydrofolate ligase [Myxococcales bacterium]|jgi:formate--tetrahydrofolate ligase|nr:formate--tetrahydrofolate ligase [Myxococcales bacterium]
MSDDPRKRVHEPRPILEVARELGLSEAQVVPYGRGKAKIELGVLAEPPRAKGRLVLVSAINPTPAGEGKTTTSIALAMGMRRLGMNAVLALREPSLGPVFGVKGGGTGGGKASLVPADDINLHFTGDIHAITTAHNLLSALVDNAIYFGKKMPSGGTIDPRLVTWGRALDMNDRFLRNVIIGLGGKAHGAPREDHFDITAASEIMAILALASDYADLEARLGRILVGQDTEGAAVTAADVDAASAMTALLRDALSPNLVQTAEGGPAIVHCGPFANIAHGCNSVLATRLAMSLGDYAITEAGFGFDLGGEKFLDVKCRLAGIFPRAIVLVVTLRALKMHGGAPVKQAGEPDAARLQAGLAHLEKHLENARAFGLTPIVAVNAFPNDTQEELAQVEAAAAKLGARTARSTGFAEGGAGAIELARVVAEVVDATDAAPPQPTFMYDASEPAEEKIRKVARAVYGAADVAFAPAAVTSLERARALGHGELPVCIAKTQLSLSDDPKRPGRPEGFVVTVRDVRIAAGAGFLVPLTGDLMTMPGLPREPAAKGVRLLPSGVIRGLMQND